MAYPSKIVDRAEVRTWIEEGRPYKWMADEYLRKYHIQISPTAFSNFRAEHDLPYRYAVDRLQDLRPWNVSPEHKGRGVDIYLQTLARLDSGMKVGKGREKSARNWWKGMQEKDLVVSYHPSMGYIAVPRRPGIDKGYIREPDPEPVDRRVAEVAV